MSMRVKNAGVSLHWKHQLATRYQHREKLGYLGQA